MGDRKARLAALAAKAGRTKTLNNSEEVEDDDDNNNKKDQQLNENNKRSVSFRNYAPNDTSIEGEKEEEEAKDAKRMRTEEKKSALQEALQEAQSDIATSKSSSKQHNAITDMAPKKINGDLKRDIQEKLSKLERRTQRAIVELLKERLEREATEETGESDSDLD